MRSPARSRGVARSPSRLARAAAACLFFAGALGVGVAACGPPAAPITVSMRMAGGPPNASVTVDDLFVGTLEIVSKRGVALPPGSHRVSVEAPGHLPWDRIVEAKEGAGPVRLDVTLTPIPD